MRTDLELLEVWRSGGAEAGQELFERHFEALHWFFRNKAGAGAEDLVQATLLACVEAQQRLRPETNFRAFMFAVARNKLVDHLGGLRTPASPIDEHSECVDELGTSPSSLIVRQEEERLLLAGLRRIPLSYQTILELFYWEDLSGLELAQAMNVPQGTVRSRIRLARDALRTAIEKLQASPGLVASTLSGLDTWARNVRPRG